MPLRRSVAEGLLLAVLPPVSGRSGTGPELAIEKQLNGNRFLGLAQFQIDGNGWVEAEITEKSMWGCC